MKPFPMPARLLVAVALCALPGLASGQEPDAPPAPSPQTWWLSGGLGLTDLSADQDTPGSMTSLRLEMRSRALSVYAEGGLGIIHRAGQCEIAGGRRVDCEKRGWWPDLGVGIRLDAYRPGSNGFYLLGELGGQGPDLTRYLDTGIGLAFSTAGGMEVGAEIRGRKGWGSDVGGTAYFFRVARPLGGGARDDGGDGRR